MKHTFKLTIGLGILFSFLFYKQEIGLNAFLFTILLIIFLATRYPVFFLKKESLICGICSLLSAFFVYWNNSDISLIAWFISLAGLMSFKGEGNFTIPNYVITYWLNLFSSPIIILYKCLQSNPKTEQNEIPDDTQKLKKTFSYITILVLVVTFFLIYQSANPLFYQFTKDIKLSDLDMGFLLFSSFGTLVVFIFAYNTTIKVFFKIESKGQVNIQQDALNSFYPKYKLNAVNLLFIILNVMLIFINLLDINYLYMAHALPEGITHAEFVHNGVGTLICSIILGTVIICFLFKGNLNLNEENKVIKLFVYLWIFQNIFMVISTIIRNNLYVDSYGLTGKRIGVYYYLSLAIIGLLTVAYKIRRQKTTYFLYATNSWIWYIVLVISSAVNWENFIYTFNFHRYNRTGKIDLEYASDFTSTNLPELITQLEIGKNWNCSNTYMYASSGCDASNLVYQRFMEFLYRYKNTKWQSSNLKDKKMYKELLILDERNQFDSLTLTNINIYNLGHDPLKILSSLKNIHSIEIPADIPLSSLYLLKNIERIKWYGTNINRLKYFKKLQKLKVLEVPVCSEKSIEIIKSILPNVTVVKNDTEISYLPAR